MAIFNPEIETMARERLSELQLQRLRYMVDYCVERVPFYRRRLGEAGIRSGADIRTLDDIRHIPFTTKDDLRENYLDGLLAVPKGEIARIHASSGTTGKPTMGFYTRRDLDTWAELSARMLAQGGVTPEDVLQVSVSYGLFTGAFGIHGGAEKLGCTIVPASAGNTHKQLLMLRDCGVTALIATPSYAAYLSDLIAHSDDSSETYSLRRVLFGAERTTDSMRRAVERNLNCFTADNYGLTEFFGPGVSGECEAQAGMHIAEDVFYPEIIEPETGVPLPDGEEGELVLTSLYREALPLLRYRTRDLTSITHEPCSCGRTSCRMRAPKARTDDMFVFKGVNIFPSEIERAMYAVEELSPYYRIILTRAGYQDSAKLRVELRQPLSSFSERELAQIEEKLTARLREAAGVKLGIELLDPDTLERFTGKAKRVEDLRYSAD